jgi:hypothetical protein
MASFTSRFFTTLSARPRREADYAAPSCRNGQTGIMANDHHPSPGKTPFSASTVSAF